MTIERLALDVSGENYKAILLGEQSSRTSEIYDFILTVHAEPIEKFDYFLDEHLGEIEEIDELRRIVADAKSTPVSYVTSS